MSALTGIQKILIAVFAVTLTGAGYFFYQSYAGTQIGVAGIGPASFTCGSSTVTDADGNVYNTVQIGQQCWMKQNMRVGTRVDIATTQTNNATIEKWCYGDTDAGCTHIQSTTSPPHTQPDGGLYQWNEAMQYSTTPGAQGICPSGWHIPTHDELTTLERAVCISGSCATDFPYDTSTTGDRGTDEGTKLKPGGSSGFEANLAGRGYASSFLYLGTDAYLWSSSASGASAWYRDLDSGNARVGRVTRDKSYGFSVRCLKNAPTTSMAQTLNANPDLSRGLVGHWTFDGPEVDWSSTTAEIRDRSGQGNHGNAYLLTNQSVTSGVLGQAINLGRSDDYIDVGNATNLQITGSITLATWARVSEFTPTYDEILISKSGDGGANNMGYALSFTNDNGPNQAYIHISSNGATDIMRYSSTTILADQWYHVVGVYDATAQTLNIYINGSVDSGISLGSVPASQHNSSVPVYLGVRTAVTSDFVGDLDDTRIYNRALSADEVKRLYQLGATTKVAQTLNENPNLENGLVGHWTFDGQDVDWSSTTAEIRDRSGQGNHGNASTSISASSVVPGVLGQAISVTGVIDSAVSDALNLEKFSLSAWITTNSTAGGYFTILCKKNYSAGENTTNYYLERNGSNIGSGFHNGSTWQIYETIENVLTVGRWYHLMSTYDGARFKIYVNGVMLVDQPETDTPSYAVSNTLCLGAESCINSNQKWEGNLDDVRIYNRALSADEVKRLYDLGR